MTAAKLDALLRRDRAATGRDAELDRALARRLGHVPGVTVPDDTGSVDHCVALIHQDLPGWSWRLGFAADGVFPYATVYNADIHFEAEASSVPLALLTVLLEALIEEGGDVR